VFPPARQRRAGGVAVACALRGRAVRAQRREANRQNAPCTAIIGQDELAAGEAQVKRMAASAQEAVAFSELAQYVR